MCHRQPNKQNNNVYRSPRRTDIISGKEMIMIKKSFQFDKLIDFTLGTIIKLDDDPIKEGCVYYHCISPEWDGQCFVEEHMILNGDDNYEYWIKCEGDKKMNFILKRFENYYIKNNVTLQEIIDIFSSHIKEDNTDPFWAEKWDIFKANEIPQEIQEKDFVLLDLNYSINNHVTLYYNKKFHKVDCFSFISTIKRIIIQKIFEDVSL